ncbi:Replication protein A 70 kDa DNA-binding subunit B [Bienertia sinuspersici]
MKKEYNYLDELTDKSKNFKVKGNTMRGAIFEDDIQIFNDAIQRNKQYEISDAIIQPVPEQYQMNQSKYQMNFNERMTLIPLTGQSSLCTSTYLSINEIPRSVDAKEELVDVLGIVLFVGETRLVPINGSDVPVRDIIITDDRNGAVHSWRLDSQQCALKHTKGFSLGSTMSTEILVNPIDEKAEKLQLWAAQNETLLRDRQSIILKSRNSSQRRIISTVAEINAKKAASTWLEQKFWLEVTMPEATLDDLYFYLGCSKCGRKGDAGKGALYKCAHCNNTQSVSVPRITFKFKAVDATGTR